MMRHFQLTLACLLAGTLASQAEVLVNVRAHSAKVLELDETYTLDLGDYFQLFGDPGPVAAFTLRMPVQTGLRQLQYQTTGNNVPDVDPEGPTREYMTYELSGGDSYTHLFDPAANASNFVWQEYQVNFQLLADVAPGTVGNFIQYVRDDEFDNVIAHRSDIGVIQLGRYRLNESDDYLFYEIDKRNFIEFEQTVDNTQGTLAMARGSSLNSAQSEFFINLVDNTQTLGKNYSVFGQVMDFTTSMPLLEEMGDAYPFDLSAFLGNAFVTAPLYAPFWLEKDSWVRIKEIDIPEGTRSGISYSFEFADIDGEEGTSEDEAADQAAFNISINGSQLVISRDDSGIALLRIKGTFSDQERVFTIPVSGYRADALAAFPGYIIENGGFLNSSWYGRMQAETYPQIFHENHGEQWVYPFRSELAIVTDYYIYDVGLESWIFTDPNIYPFMYLFRTGRWLGYVLNTGDGAEEPRFFWDFGSQKWVYTNAPGSLVELP